MADAPRARADTPSPPDTPDTPSTLPADAPLAGAKTWPPVQPLDLSADRDAVRAGTPLHKLCAGVGVAVHTLLVEWAQAGPTSCVWSERFVPLCSAESPLVSFPWLMTGPAKPMPRATLIEEFVHLLATRLGALESDIIVAYILFESLVRPYPNQLRIQTTRPLLLVCIIVAMKANSDDIITTYAALACVEDVLDAVSAEDIAVMERKLVELTDWRVTPEPVAYQTYRLALLDAAR